jgi:sugar-phosphatase
VERHWAAFCARHGLDLAEVLSHAYGVRTSDTLRLVAPHLDAERESSAFDDAEARDVEGLVPVRGAPELLAALDPGRWGIVTSGHRVLATRRLAAVGLEQPAVLVCGDDIDRGKPDPSGYLLGAQLLGVEPGACTVVEDAPAGIAAARAAGMRVIGVSTTFPAGELRGADAVIDDLTGLLAALAANH